MIEVRQLKKHFGTQLILDGVNLQIDSGQSAVIIGRSGGGKSELLKHLIGLLQPDAGDVLVDGESITHMNERQLLRVREKFGMVFQGAARGQSGVHATPEKNLREWPTGNHLRRDGSGGATIH